MSVTLTDLNSISVGGKHVNFRIHIDTLVHAKNKGRHQSLVTDINQNKYTLPFSVSYLPIKFPDANLYHMDAGEIICLNFWDEESRKSFDCKTIKLAGKSYQFSPLKVRKLIQLRTQHNKLKCAVCNSAACLLNRLKIEEMKVKIKRLLSKKHN